ncbi:hypothetical protein D3C84_310660 [compost metagenome]
MRPVLEQVVDGHREVVVRCQQTTGRGDDAVTVVVRVAGKGNVEALLETDQALHGMAGGRVHADLAVPVHRHETECRIDLSVHHIEVQAVVFGDGRPVAHPCSAQRIHAQTQIGPANGVEVDHIDQIGDVGVEVVMTVSGVGLQRLFVADALDPGQLVGQQLVGLGLDPLGDVGIGRAAVGGVVLVTATLRWVMGRRDDNAICQPRRAAAVVAQDGVGNGWGRRVLIAFGDHHRHPVGSQYFQGAGTGRRRQRMGIDADKQRTVDALGFAIQANGLADGQDVPFIETQLERAATVPRRTERNALGSHRGIGLAGVIGRNQSRDIDQQGCWCRFARKRTECHAKPLKEWGSGIGAQFTGSLTTERWDRS